MSVVFKSAKIISLLLFVVLLSVSITLAASGAWNVDGNGNWNDNANWDGVSFPNGAAESATFGGAIGAPRVVTIDGAAIAISEMTLDNGNSYTIAAANGGSLAFAGGGNGQLTVNAANGNGAHQISTPLILNRNLTVTQNSAGALTISGNISQDGINRSLTKNGSGTLLLNGSNTFGGDITVNGGALAIGSNMALGTGTLKPGSNTTISGQNGARVIANNINLANDMIFDGDPLNFTNTGIQLPGNRRIVVNNTTSLARINDPTNGRNLRIKGNGIFNINLSTSHHPLWIRNEYDSNAGLNIYATGTVGRIIYGGSGGRLSPGDTLDVATSIVTKDAGTVNVAGEIVLHANTTLDIDLNGVTPGAQYDTLTYNQSASGGCNCVSLNEATLNVKLGFTPTPGDTFSIISRAGGSGIISGNFKNLPQGAVFLANGSQLLVNYMPIGPDPTEVRLTRVDIPAAGVVAQSGSGQSANLNTDFAQPLQIKVVDPNGNPIANVRITFNAPASGAGATFPGGNVGLTDANGLVSVTVKANDTAGSYNVTANIGPDSVNDAVFSLTNTSPGGIPNPSSPKIYLPMIVRNS